MTYSSGQVARELGIAVSTLSRYITRGKIPTPKSVTTGGITVYLWTEADIERVRKLLPRIKNGRKTRYRKKESAVRSQESAKTKTKKQPQPRAAVPHKQREKKK